MELEVILTAPTPQRVGMPLVISIEVRNISDHPLWMVGVLDGSEAGFRFPHYLPFIKGPRPLPQPENIPWCGMVAPLRLQDFHYLLPDEGFDPTVPHDNEAYQPLTVFAGFRPPFPGRYEFSLTVSTESKQENEWLGILEYPGKEEVLERLARVPRLMTGSNTAIVDII